MTVDAIERWTRSLGAIAGLGTLLYAVAGMFASLQRPRGREEHGAPVVLRAPLLALATILFVWIGALLWHSLPLQVPPWLRVLLLCVGAFLFYGGLALYVWGMRSLGAMFGPSSGFAVRLYAGHRLVTTGPYAHVRHPMYLAVMAAAMGSLLLYRTWATLGFAAIMFGLVVRARREERVLAQEFGPEWQTYASQVPAWLPRLRGRGDKRRLTTRW